MPIVALLALVLVVGLLAIALLPLSLVQRYRVGTARRRARHWVIVLNLAALVISILGFVITAAVTATWVQHAFSYTLIGLACGFFAGLLGLGLTRWEPGPDALHYTPPRWLVLAVTLLVTARVIYGFWHSWHALDAGPDAWARAFGIAESMAAGAVVLSYYATYWFGVRRRLKRYAVGQ